MGAESPPRPQLKPVAARGWIVTPRVVAALVLREMSTTYGRSPGGYLWAVLEPVAGIALLTAVFSVGFRSPSLGVSFPLFYATGILPFTLYLDAQSKVAQSLEFSSALLAYPRLTFLDTLLARFLLNGLTQLLVSYLVFSMILLIYDTRTSVDLPAVMLGYLMALSLAFGIGVMNCYLGLRFPTWRRIWAILNRPLFLISCVFFLFETIPEPYRSFLWFNPLVHVVGQVRAGFYPFYHPDYISVSYVMGLSLTLSAGGLVLLRDYQDLLDR